MIIYNKTWYSNLRVQTKAQQSCDTGYITTDELKAIKQKYAVGFYSPNVFIRIGLFILTCVIILFASGLVGLMTMDSIRSLTGYGVLTIIGGIITYAVLGLMVKDKFHYRSGVDDALLYLSAILIFTGIYLLLNESINLYPEFGAFLACLIAIFLTLRFADTVTCAVAYLTLFYCCYILTTRFSSAITPFLLMLVSVFMYLSARKTLNKPYAINYSDCLTVLQIVTLTTFYLSGNYFVVREVGSNLSNLAPGTSLPLSWFFWAWTIAIPFAYILLGIKKKDVILIRAGLLFIGIAALTYRNYYYLMPIEIMLIMSGIVAIGTSYSIIKYLTPSKKGFTYADLNEKHIMDKLNIESIVIAETLAPAPIQTESRPAFGGGDFGGGGAGEKF
ncbi:hypothetical protein [Solitalea lacus]|uniref:hypothetical protein n=1 Tax=Solitalea lacus TaxID=2911172 RepID=UPI001ED9E8A7|nr:hypothetical protein [Solitalea lacus]UKJ06481.1 hypothetical protein L2B55_13170 [Solitalea lacus]